MQQRDYDKRAVQRFWSKVGPPDDNGCRPWLGKVRRYSKAGASKGRPSYGVLWYSGREMYAHVFAAKFLLGHDTEGKHVSHICHNKRCCNPAHLLVETPAQNARRSVYAGHYELEHQGRKRRFTDEQIADIRRMYDEGWIQADLAEFFECSQRLVSRIARHEIYK
jgi:hypothetical protein